MSGVLDIGIKSLLANQHALMVTSQNIANANTPGYARRRTVFEENAGYDGVRISDTKRIVNETLNASARSAASIFSGAKKLADALTGFETYFEGDKSGISSAIVTTLSSLEKLAASPGLAGSRELFISSLGNLSSRVQSASDYLTNETENVNREIQAGTDEINSLLQSIANINHNLMAASQDNNVDTLSLADQRDSILDKLSEWINFSTQIDEKTGVVKVSLQNGLPLVNATDISSMMTVADGNDPSLKVPGILNAGHSSIIDSSLIQGGKLSGLMAFRNTLLQPLTRQLDRLSVCMAFSLNTRNSLGIDGNGNQGSFLLNDVNADKEIGNRAVAALSNTGSGTLLTRITDVSSLTASDYQLNVGASGTYSLTRVSDSVVVSSGVISGSFPQTITAEGFSLTLAGGVFEEGDHYRIEPVKGGAENFSLFSVNPSRVALAWPVSTSRISQSQQSTASVSVSAITDMSTSTFSVKGELNPPIRIEFIAPDSYQLVDAGTSSVIEGPISYNPSTGANVFPTPLGFDPGYGISISGSPSVGDQFAIGYNNNWQGDNRNGLELAKLFKSGVMENNQTFSSAFSSLVGTIATTASQANFQAESADAIHTSARSLRESISGVNNEEESMSLFQFQQAYQASAQVLQVAQNMMHVLLNMIGG